MVRGSETHRDRIVRAALRIVDENGPKALNAEKVGAAMGGGRTLVYYYFPKMADLMSAVVDVYVARFGHALDAWEEQTTQTPPEDGTAWCRSIAALLRKELVDDCKLLHAAAPNETPSPWVLYLQLCAAELSRRAQAGHEALAPMRQERNGEETTTFAVTGFAGMVRSFPQANDNVAAVLFARAWHVVRAQTEH